MAVLDPVNTTMGDLVGEALKVSGRLGLGQVALAEDTTLGWTYLQWMLQQWQTKRFHVYRLTSVSFVSTGAASYTIGPAGNFNLGTSDTAQRPTKIESAFVRDVNVGGTPPDDPLIILKSREDYNRISVKALSSKPTHLFYDPVMPLGVLYFWPLPTAVIYELFVTIRQQLPFKFLNQAVVITLPFEYYWAIVTNLGMMLRTRYGIRTWAGDTLPGQAKEALKAIKDSSVAIPELEMPGELVGGHSGYNIFSDSYGG